MLEDHNANEITPHKLNKNHFDYFKQEVLLFQKLLGLYDWEIFFIHTDIDARADITYNITGRCATIRLAKSWYICEPTYKELSLAAFHEILHLLLADYQDVIGDASMTTTAKIVQVETLDHIIIRRFENLLFNILKKEKPYGLEPPKQKGD